MKPSLAALKEQHFDPVLDSQHVFRELMMAMAFPGQPRRLRPLALAVATPEEQFALQPLLTLLDLETGFFVAPAHDDRAVTVADYLAINTNSRPKASAEADFVLCLGPGLGETFATLKRGSLERPNDGATIFYLVDDISGEPDGDALAVTLTGPGIRNHQTVHVKGVSPAETDLWARSRTGYPLGVDIYLISRGGDLIGIPRSVTLAVSGGLA